MPTPETPAPKDESPKLGPLPEGVKLPPKRKVASLNLPKKEEKLSVLPKLENLSCKCPYCGAKIVWPPAGLKCPTCSHVLRPPPGFAPKDAAKRKAAKEKIAETRDRALREMGERVGGDRRSRMVWTGVGLLFLVVAGAGMLFSSGQAKERKPRRDRIEVTTNLMDTICMALAHYKADTGHFPLRKEGGLLALYSDPGTPNWCGPYVRVSSKGYVDGWNQPFIYDVTNDFPCFYSSGPDKAYKTADDITVAPDQFRCHPDFVPHDTARLRMPHARTVEWGSPKSVR